MNINRSLVAFGILAFLTFGLYTGTYVLFRAIGIFEIRFSMAKASIDIGHEYYKYSKSLKFLYSGYMAFESGRITKSNPGSADLGPRMIKIIDYKSKRVGMHTGNPDAHSDSFVTNNFWGQHYGYWNVDEISIRKAIDALEKVTVYGDISYDSQRPPWANQFKYFIENYKLNRYGMQAIGVYNKNKRRVFFNLGNNLDFHANNDRWTNSAVFCSVDDGGANYIRFEYDIENDKILNFDTNGRG